MCVQELKKDGIALVAAEDALTHDADKMKADEQAAEAARKAAERAQRDLSPRPNNLDFHHGFERVNSNLLLRTIGASTGADLDDGPPALIKGPVNLCVACVTCCARFRMCHGACVVDQKCFPLRCVGHAATTR